MENNFAFGCMRLPLLDADDKTSIDMPQFERMVDTFLERGFTYFDTAWMYHDQASEPAVGNALVARHPRDSFTVTTKMPLPALHEEADHERIFNAQLEKCQVEYFDYYLAHNINVASWETVKKLNTFDFLRKMKEEGKIKHMGFSFHDTPELLDEVLTANPDVEFVQIQLNYLDWEDPTIQSRRCYETILKHGKQVLVMEPVKGGMLANVPAEAEAILKAANPDLSPATWAIRFAASLDGVFKVLSGMSSFEQLDENTRVMQEFQPLTDEEREMLFRVAEIIRADTTIPCTNCRYCVEGCPMEIPIPNYLALYNEFERHVFRPRLDNIFQNFSQEGGLPSSCIECHQCTSICPQHIEIPDWLTKVAAEFEA